MAWSELDVLFGRADVTIPEPPPWWPHLHEVEIQESLGQWLLRYPLLTIEREVPIGSGMRPDFVASWDDHTHTVIEVKRGVASSAAFRQLAGYVEHLQSVCNGSVFGLLAAQQLRMPEDFRPPRWFGFLDLRVTFAPRSH